MPTSTPVAGWEDVRNRELSDIITRRVVEGTLSPATEARVIQRWIEEGVLPTQRSWDPKPLAGILAEWLDRYSLTPGALAEIIKLRRHACWLPPEAKRLTPDTIKAALDDKRDPPGPGHLAQLATVFASRPLAKEAPVQLEQILSQTRPLLTAWSTAILHALPEDAPEPDEEVAEAKKAFDGDQPPLAPSDVDSLILFVLILEALLRREVSGNLVGLALSGGGIRSASFNLGLLQSLQQYEIFDKVDYLSTVSGGGYVGSLVSSLVYAADPATGSGHRLLTKALRPGDDGKQPDRVVKLVRSGSYLHKPLLHLSRYLLGVLLNNLVIFSALLALCTAAALFWRGLDMYPVAEWLRYYSGGWISDWSRPFVPALALLFLWALVSAASLAWLGERSQPYIARFLLFGAGLCLFIGAAVWLATPAVDVPWLAAQTPECKPALLNVGDHPLLVLLALALLGVVPFLLPRTFLASGTQPRRSTFERMAFRVLSLALLAGIPFFIVYLLARHNLAAQVAQLNPHFNLLGERDRPDSTRRWQLHPTDIQYSRWRSFWDHLQEESKRPHTVGWYVWERLKGVQGPIKQTLEEPLLAEIQAVAVPIPSDTEAGSKKEQIIKSFNQKVLGDVTFKDDILRKAPRDIVAGTLARVDERAATMHEGQRLRLLLEGDKLGQLLDADKRDLNRLLLEAYYGWWIWERATIRRCVVIERDQAFRWWVFLSFATLALVSSLFVGLNATSLHGVYRRQLAQVYIEPVGKDASDIPLCRLATTEQGTPYHLLSGSLNKGVLQQDDPRPTTHYLFSRRFCGSIFTGFSPTEEYLDGTLDLATAMAISGAAFSPARMDNRLIAFLMVVLNLRLGQWLCSPRFPRRVHRLPIARLLGSLIWHRGVDRCRYWFISDGGHSENLGLGPLLRRECQLMIVSDAGYDPDYGFDDFVSLYRHARIQGIRFRTLDQRGFISVDPLVPDKATGNSPHRYLIALVEYPGTTKRGLLIYLKPSFSGDEGVDLLRYRKVNTAFPHDPTVNQWFNEDQVESYRELGAWIGERVCQVLLRELFKRPCTNGEEFTQLVAWVKEQEEKWRREQAERSAGTPVRMLGQVEEVRAQMKKDLVEVMPNHTE
jgi:hypothetical protein